MEIQISTEQQQQWDLLSVLEEEYTQDGKTVKFHCLQAQY